MKIQVASNVSINQEQLNKNIQEREPHEALNVIEEISAVIDKAKKSDSRLQTAQKIQRQVDHMNKLFEVNYTSVKFNVHEDTERLMIRVVDRKTEEIVREIPSEEFLDMVSRMVDYMGFMVDQKI